ncbi:MAG: GIY-YIG nuclease family protein [Pirellulaceae bacterium]|nr:GIY-YIG nuclease family protein [Pirellulaceae bacterium]
MGKKKLAKVTFTDDDDVLLAELGVEVEVRSEQTYTAKQERIIAGFEDVQRFYREHDRTPQHGADRDIFERLHAVRLDRIRASEEYLSLLRGLDSDGILQAVVQEDEVAYLAESDDELLNELGVGANASDITKMTHVRPIGQRGAERRVADEIAQRKPCVDFDEFRLDFEAVQADIETGRQSTELFRTSSRSQIRRGDWFILDGQKTLVADAEAWFTAEHGERDRRLRVIFDNGTEADLLLRSLRRALNKDEGSRRIVPFNGQTDDDLREVGPLFSGVTDETDLASGVIYVARSLSDHPFVQEHQELLHKIGLTTGEPEKRIANAKKEATYLLAEAEVVAVYRLANINCRGFESLLHKFLARARIDLALADRFGGTVQPREWFLVPLPVIEEVVERIKDGTITSYVYDVQTASIRRR